ncbi:hypothetical protein P8452_22692 [Trifolium repens]|nr:hypothetical protein P8452_22692 [Trifolium repens]
MASVEVDGGVAQRKRHRISNETRKVSQTEKNGKSVTKVHTSDISIVAEKGQRRCQVQFGSASHGFHISFSHEFKDAPFFDLALAITSPSLHEPKEFDRVEMYSDGWLTLIFAWWEANFSCS